MKPKTIVLDNGGSTIKLGVLGVDDSPRIIPNGVFSFKGRKETYVGQELDTCKDFASLHYQLPFEKGLLIDWDAQKAVWDQIFYSDQLGVETMDTSLLITEPYFDLPKLQETYDQFVFEEYEFKSYYRCPPASLMPHSDIFSNPAFPMPECMLIVDSGFSFTHVVPIMDGSIVWNAVKRIDVGGKFLTNHLKNIISFRQWDMMTETYIMNDVKEACCYVAQNFKQDLETCKKNPRKNPIVQEYILPDYSIPRPGHVRQADEPLQDSYQIIYMENERFSVPEVIFRPDDLGFEQSGLSGTIAHSISLLPEDLQGMFWANIGLTGGNTKFPGFKDRLQMELRSLAPSECAILIYQAPEPILSVYSAALAYASTPAFQQHLVTRAEYQESGSNACRRKFTQDWRPFDLDSVGAGGVGTGKGKGRAKEEHTDSASDEGGEGEDEKVVVASTKKGTKSRGKGRGRGAATATKKK